MRGISGFIRQSGWWVGVSSVYAKILAFGMMLFLVWVLSESEFGRLTIALNFVGFFIPMVGFGASHGMLRFGARSDGEALQDLRHYALRQGIGYQAVLSVVVIASALVFYWEQWAVLGLVFLMLFRLFGLFLLEQAKAEVRAELDNKKYARIEIVSNSVALVSGVLLTIFYGAWGYVVSLCLYPFSVLFLHRFRSSWVSLEQGFRKAFWDFSIKSVLTYIVFMWVFLLDVFFVGRYFSAEAVGWYKISTLIPMNLIFLAQVYTQTLYPELCRRADQKTYLRHFIKTYYFIFIPVTGVLLVSGYWFSRELMALFGEGYQDVSVLKIMFWQMASCILMRIPMGNLLSAMGHITASLFIGVAILLSMLLGYLFFLPGEKPLVAAVISLICITLGGVMAVFFFVYKFSKLE